MKIFLIYPYFLEPRLHPDEISAVPSGPYYVGTVHKENSYNVDLLNWYEALGERRSE